MKILKTIVATAVVVFALTTVAAAGVQHLTRQTATSGAAAAQSSQPTYTVTLTAAQFARLMQGGATGTQTQDARHTRSGERGARDERNEPRDRNAASHKDRDKGTGGSQNAGSGVSSSGGSSGDHHSEPVHSSASSHSGSSGGDSGGHDSGGDQHSGGDGGDCGD